MNDELFAIEDITVALATRLMEEKGMDMIDALDAIYNSDTFAKVVDKSTGLMCNRTEACENCKTSGSCRSIPRVRKQTGVDDPYSYPGYPAGSASYGTAGWRTFCNI